LSALALLTMHLPVRKRTIDGMDTDCRTI